MQSNVYNYPELIRLPDAQLIAITAYCEAANQREEGLMAVINVIMNRVQHPIMPNYYDADVFAATGSMWKAVILAGSDGSKQFSCFNSADPQLYTARRLAASFDYVVATTPALSIAYNLAQLAVTGILTDNTYGATLYFNPSLANPSWAYRAEYTTTIGAHKFYTELPASMRVRDVVTASNYPTSNYPTGNEPVTSDPYVSASIFDTWDWDWVSDISSPEIILSGEAHPTTYIMLGLMGLLALNYIRER